MKYLSLVVLCALAISAVIHLGTFASAQTAQGHVPLIVGTWRLNAEKSNVRLPPDALEIRQYRMRQDGFLVGLLITSNAQGYHYLQFTAKSDGKDYPEYTETLLADMIAAGKQTPRTYSEKIVDEYVTEWTDKADGRITAQGKKTISKDGKTLTVTTDSATSPPRIYDRQ
jgi:hypothetical protein